VPSRPTELLQGTLDILILKALTWGPMHGYAVASWIERVTDDVLRIEEGSLYPALHRLEERDLVIAEWGVSDNNRRAKFYRLTPSGRQYLRSESSSWSRYVEAVRKVLQAAEHPAAGRA
jgi:PadR family transcriptional regulator, regulatory protein PadR